MKKVCMIVGNPFVNDSRVLKEAQSLTKAGYQVTVYATRKNDLPAVEKKDGFVVKRIANSFSPFKPKIWEYFTEFSPAYKSLIREKADVYHAHDLDTLPIAYLSAKRNKSKTVYDSHEIFLGTNTAYERPFIAYLIGQLKIPLWAFLERWLVPRVDCVIVVSPAMNNYFKEKYSPKSIITLMNVLPKQNVAVRNERMFHKIFRLKPATKVILYQGGLGWRRGMKQLVESVQFYLENWVLVIMGSGSILGSLKDLSSKLGISKKVRFLDPVPIEDLPKYTGSADLGIIPTLNVSLNNYYSAPNKLFEYLGSGIAIACSDLPFMRKVVLENNIGLVFNPQDPKDIADKVKKILSDEGLLEKMKVKAFKLGQTRYNWEFEEKKLVNLYKNLLS